MKKTLFMLALICSFTIAAIAQNQKTVPSPSGNMPNGQGKGGKHETPEQRAQQSLERLDQIVILTADQKTKVNDLALTRAKNVDAIREKYKGQQDKRELAKGEIQTAHKEYRQSVKKLLTPDQIVKIKEHFKANKEKGQGEQGEGNGDLPTEKD